MKEREFERCCQAVGEGDEIVVENISTHEKGRLLFCHMDEIDVLVGDDRKTWPASMVVEVSSSSEIPHR